MSHHLNPFNRGQLRAVSELLLQGKDRVEIFREIYPLVLAQTEPFVFSENPGNGAARVPKAVYDQIPLAFYAIGSIREKLLEKVPEAASYLAPVDSRFDGKSREAKRERARLYATVKAEFERNSPAPTPIPDPVPDPSPAVPVAPDGIRAKLIYLQRRLNELRSFVQAKKVGNREFDYVSTRAFVHGKNAILAGIDVDDFLWSIGASWSEDARREAGLLYDVDYGKYAIPGTSKLTGFVVRLIAANIPVYLYGPTGSGKSVLARQVAEFLGREYGEIPLSLGVSRTDLFGNWTPNGFVRRSLEKLYGNGGIQCFEEIDAADPNILLAVNNAVANSHLFNTVNGEVTERHEDYASVATANTLGNGATANFQGREGLDGSTLDRFKYGRVFVDYDPAIEAEILFCDIEALENAEISCK